MSDEFSRGLRGRRKTVANRARPAVNGADVKPEALNRVKTNDRVLDSEINKLQRAVEQIQGARGQRADQGVNFRDLENRLKSFTAEIENGFLQTGSARSSAENAENTAQSAESIANLALAAANEAHTNEVTSPPSSRVLTLNVAAIDNRSLVLPDTGDELLVRDSSDGSLRKITVDDLLDGGTF